MDSPTEGERDSLLRDVNSNASDETPTLQANYGIQSDEKAETGQNWEYAGKGDEVVYNNLIVDEDGFEKAKALKIKHALGQLVSTAISGAFSLYLFEHSIRVFDEPKPCSFMLCSHCISCLLSFFF